MGERRRLNGGPRARDHEIVSQLGRLLTILEPHADALWDLVRQGYQANWFCYVASNPAEHAVELNRELLGRLQHLPGDLWLDVCGDCPSPGHLG